MDEAPRTGDWHGDDRPCCTCRHAHRAQHGAGPERGQTFWQCHSLEINQKYDAKRGKYSSFDCAAAYEFCKDEGYERRISETYDFDMNPPLPGSWLTTRINDKEIL